MTRLQAIYPGWPRLNGEMSRAVTGLTVSDLARSAGSGRWPLWAVIGHAACQRVFWLCDIAGEDGAADTMFPNAGWMCPGDDDLDHPLDSHQLTRALDETFRIIERVLDTWTLTSLTEKVDHPDGDAAPALTRGFIVERVFAHDVWHAAEANEILTAIGRSPIDPWA